MKHTEGRWTVSYQDGDKPYVVAEHGRGWKNPIVCQLYADVTPADSVTFGPWLEAFENAQANARLIAAAPAMRSALLECEVLLSEYPVVLRMVREAIKAGE